MLLLAMSGMNYIAVCIIVFGYKYIYIYIYIFIYIPYQQKINYSYRMLALNST